MQTEQCIFIFSYNKCSIKQVTDNDNYMAYEDLTSVPKVRHASNPVIWFFRYNKYCMAMQRNVELSVVLELSEVLQTVVTWVQGILANLLTWEVSLSFSSFCLCLPLFCSNRCQKHLLCFYEEGEKFPNLYMEKTNFVYVSFALPKA